MNNETDLDWLARNVHVWPCGMREVLACYGRNVDALIWSRISSNVGWITKEQWLARRAELQNKPSFADHPDAKCFVQQDDGEWFKNTTSCEVHPISDGGWQEESKEYGWVKLGSGEVLGDWRDTLEKRPEEFQPFTSIEDNQEKDMKQDNGWFERGELPPVGARCEALSEPDMDWLGVEVIAHRDGFAIVWCSDERCGANCDDPKHFRPIRTERDVLVELIQKHRHSLRSDTEMADAILVAGFSLGAK